MFDKYKDYEQAFLQTQNQVILQDEGVPTVMQNLQKEFMGMLSGALMVCQPSDKDRVHVDELGRKKMTPDQEKDKIDAIDPSGNPLRISLHDYMVQQTNAAQEGQMMPELDPQNVMVDSKAQFQNFVHMYSAIYTEEIQAQVEKMNRPEMKGASSWAMNLKAKVDSKKADKEPSDFQPAK